MHHGATIAMVECGACGRWVAERAADILDDGYRCDACTLDFATRARTITPMTRRRGLISELEREATELVEPTPAAPVPAAAEVTCVRCGAKVALADSDLCGLGYRCRACTLRAEVDELEGKADVADHLVAADRARFAEQGKQLAIKAGLVGALIAVAGVGLMLVAPAGSSGWLKVMMSGLMVALAIGGRGLDRWRRFRK